MYHNIRLLSRRHEVHVVSYVEDDQEAERVSAIAPICASVETIRRCREPARRRAGVPPAVGAFDSPALRDAVDRHRRMHGIQVLQCEYTEMAQFHRPDLFTVWTVIDLLSAGLEDAFRSERSVWQRARRLHRWRSMRRYESGAARRFDRVITMTAPDAEYMRALAPGADVRAIPIGIDPDHFSPGRPEPGAPLRVLFLGNFRHDPNVEAARFLRDVLAPAMPEMRFEVAGGGLPDGFFDRTPVRSHGHRSDTRGLYSRPNTIVVAPVFSGRGQRVKLLEAFAMGVPVVTTALGASGYPVRDRHEALLAETPVEFGTALTALRDSVQLRENVGAGARRMILERFDWEVLAPLFLEAVDRSV